MDGGCALSSLVGLSVLRFECCEEGASLIASSLMSSSSGASK